MGRPGTTIFQNVGVAPLLHLGQLKAPGIPQSAHLRARLKKMNIDQTAQEMSVIGIDVSLEHLDIHCRPCGTSMRLSNDEKGHAKLVALAREKNALVGFEATGGCEWRALLINLSGTKNVSINGIGFLMYSWRKATSLNGRARRLGG